MEKKTVAVVMCTYNGESYLREQIDSILCQTHPADEIIIQDDGSTDKTVDIIVEYQKKHKEILFYRNEERKGVNENFYTAMERSRCDYIAIADQDDVWAADKLECQLSAIGDKLLCIGKDKFFYTGVEDGGNDEREINYSALRMIFCSVAGGHTFLISRRMLDYLPLMRSFPRTYDAPIQIIGAVLDSVVTLSQYTQYHRMHAKSATYAKQVNNKKTLGNAWSYASQSWKYYRELRPKMRQRMEETHKFLSRINTNTPPETLINALKMTELQMKNGLLNFIKQQLFCMKHCDELFFAKEKRTLLTYLRAAYFPISCCYYVRYMSKTWKD